MAVYAVLKQTKEHPNVEMIYKNLNLTTRPSAWQLYIKLWISSKIGLIQELNIGDGSLRFDSNTNPHAHVYCKNCGKVTDVENVSLNSCKTSCS